MTAGWPTRAASATPASCAWSRALWDIRQALGNVKADTIILQGSFDFPGTTMPALANRTVAAAQQLYGTAAAKAVTRAFTDRGIL